MQLIYSNAPSVSFAMKPRCKFETCDFSHSDQAVVTRHEENDCPVSVEIIQFVFKNCNYQFVYTFFVYKQQFYLDLIIFVY